MSYLQHQIGQLIKLEEDKYEPYYETLEYVSLDGTQYFDTGYHGNTIKTSVDFDLSIDDFNNNAGVCGSRNDTTATENSMCILFLHSPLGSSSRDALRFDWVGGNGNIFSNTLVEGARYHVTCTSNKATINDEVYTATGTRNFDQTQTFLIGTVHSGNGVVFNPAMVGKIYVFKIFENGVLIYDYVPALDSQMRPCLYDKISKTFIYAKKIADGTTTYDLGFKRWNKYDVDYIQSSGTQYINTEYAFQDDFAYEIEYEGLNNGECLIGGRTSSTRTAILYRAMATQVDGQTTVPIAGLNATQTPFKLGVLSDTKHKIKVAIANNKGNVWVDDTQIYTNQSFTGTYISGKTTAIFADHFGDLTGTSEYQEYATSKLYALKFWQGTTIVRDYKPTVWHNGNTTAVACLYDEVYNKIYTNAGTGSLKAYITDISTTKTDVFTTTGATSGKAINAEGQIINSSASSYSALLPIVGGTVIECVSGNTGNNNYRFHCYDSNGNWIEQSLVLYPEGAGTVSPITGSFTAPSNAKYVRVSYATQASSTIQVKSVTETIYEVGSGIQSTAKTEYVELDYFPDKDTSLECWTTVTDWGYVPTQYSYRSTNIFGSGSVSTDDSYTFGVGFDGSLTMGRRAGTPITGMNASINTKYIIYQDKDVAFYNNMTSYNDTPLYYGTEEEPLIPPDVQAQGNTLTVFKNPLSAVIGTLKIHYFKINENYITVREVVPVKSGSIIGLYDKVSKRFFGNSGSGTFTFNSLD